MVHDRSGTRRQVVDDDRRRRLLRLDLLDFVWPQRRECLDRGDACGPVGLTACLRGLQRATRSEAKEFFEVDPDELAELILDARHYADEVLPKIAEADRLSQEECDDRMVQASDEEWEMYRELVQVREAYDTLEFDKARLEAELKLAIGTAAGMERVANWRMVSTHRFDADTFSHERPELYAAYLRESRSRRFNLL